MLVRVRLFDVICACALQSNSLWQIVLCRLLYKHAFMVFQVRCQTWRTKCSLWRSYGLTLWLVKIPLLTVSSTITRYYLNIFFYKGIYIFLVNPYREPKKSAALHSSPSVTIKIPPKKFDIFTGPLQKYWFLCLLICVFAISIEGTLNTTMSCKGVLKISSLILRPLNAVAVKF